MRLRSRGERPGRRQTSPKSTTSVYSARAGAISPNDARAAMGFSDISDIDVSFDGMKYGSGRDLCLRDPVFAQTVKVARRCVSEKPTVLARELRGARVADAPACRSRIECCGQHEPSRLLEPKRLLVLKR